MKQSTLFICKLGTLIDPSSTAHKHLEPIAFAMLVHNLFDKVVIACKDGLVERQRLNNIEFANSNTWCIATQHAKSEDCVLLWQDCLEWFDKSKQPQVAAKLALQLYSWNVSKARRFALTTDLRYRFNDKQSHLIDELFNIAIAKSNEVVELSQAKLAYVDGIFKQQVHLPLQINAAVLPMNLQCPDATTPIANITKQIDAAIDTWRRCSIRKDAPKLYRLCFSSAGMNGLDDFRFNIMYKALLQFNRQLQDCYVPECCNFITTHVDARMSDLLLHDASIKAKLDITWQVPYDLMRTQLGKSTAQLIAGDALYDAHQLVTNKWVEGCLAETANLVVGKFDIAKFDKLPCFVDIDKFDSNEWYRTINYINYDNYVRQTIVDNQWVLFASWCSKCFIGLQTLFKC